MSLIVGSVTSGASMFQPNTPASFPSFARTEEETRFSTSRRRDATNTRRVYLQLLLLGVTLTSRTLAQSTVILSTNSSGNEGNGSSYGQPTLSADGRVAAFSSEASNLVPG